ncbi:MAG TPA: transcription antitermination factor NusB [Abditibacteriaceae bacterium]|jgi:N utilization substance protein B
MGKRRNGREHAFRVLFQTDVGGLPLDEAIAGSRAESDAGEGVWEMAEQLARGAWEKRNELDAIITKYASGWTLERMANADRNLLRIALYEIIHCPEVPQNVAINEAVELAKRYSTADSAKFINGIIGSFLRERPSR